MGKVAMHWKMVGNEWKNAGIEKNDMWEHLETWVDMYGTLNGKALRN